MHKSILAKVKVGPGLFSNERSVVLQLGFEQYNFLVNETQIVENNLVELKILDLGTTSSIVLLPGESPKFGRQIRLENRLLNYLASSQRMPGAKEYKPKKGC